MYLAIDVGGTKTLAGLFDDSGELVVSERFKTPKDYSEFINELQTAVSKITAQKGKAKACCIALPGLVDRESGVVQALGNLPWRNKPIRKDVAEIVGDAPVIIENDARLAGLAEASVVRFSHSHVLYLTVSTGIGGALIWDGKIVKELQDTEVGKMPLEHNGKVTNWEEFASGRWLKDRFGKQASELDDDKAWDEVGDNIAKGVGALCSVLQPQVVIFGGGVGQYAEKFVDRVSEYLMENLHPVVRKPKSLRAASFPDDAVLRGCYIHLKSQEK